MAAELAPDRIRVNTVCPGSILTPMVEAQLGGPEERNAKETSIADLHLLGRIGEPADVAHAVLYLASDDSSFVTGSSLVVDGGLTAV
jgi:NAD(P)-dependent dehydrogenase (short-subunit alcohol dehydrogenase family)